MFIISAQFIKHPSTILIALMLIPSAGGFAQSLIAGRILGERFPSAIFILVQCSQGPWEARLGARAHTISLDYARKVAGLYEPPSLDHFTVDDSADGSEAMRQQIAGILAQAGTEC